MRNEKSLKIRSSQHRSYSCLGRICFSVLFAVLAFMTQAQNIPVSGTVIDETGEPVIGATVMEKGTKNGAATDFDGKFTLTIPSSATLVFSYVGYTTQEVPVDGRSVINVTLKESREMLDEVVVVGYGTVRRRDLTGAVSSMKNSDVVIAPTNNVMEALQGKIAGMDITKSSGETGSDVNILLRQPHILRP